jgi:ketosteroid isomerase-like protein
MAKHITIVFLCAAVMLVTCEKAAADADDIQKAIESVLHEQVQGWNEGDIDKYMAGYAHFASLRFASGGNVFYGWQTTYDRYKEHYPDRASMGTLEFSDIDVTVICSDAALVFGKWKLKREKDEPSGLFTLLMRKTEDGWRIVHDHTSAAQD